MFDELVKFFVVLLVVVEPLSLLPILAGLTQGADESYLRRMSCKAVGIAAVVCLGFATVGAALLHVLGISVDAFKVGGGILLFLLAIEMVFARPSGARSITPGEDAEAHHRADISVFPLAFPLIAGPGRAGRRSCWRSPACRSARCSSWAQIVVIIVVLAITLALMLRHRPGDARDRRHRRRGARAPAGRAARGTRVAVRHGRHPRRDDLTGIVQALRNARSHTPCPSRWPRCSKRVSGRLSGRGTKSPASTIRSPAPRTAKRRRACARA